MTIPVYYLSLAEACTRMARGELTAVELLEACCARIDALDGRLHGFITVAEDQARAEALAVDVARRAGRPLGPLAGLPLGVKDSIPTRGIRTTANSRLLEHWTPAVDAAPIRRLRAAGAIILGKTNLNEFGWSVPTEHDLGPTPRNPWNPRRAAIGSSSGSGIAVAAGMALAAVGTDGGGSARLPAGQNNLVSIKATHGLVSRLHMDSSSISEISPITRTVRDAALMLQVMAGYETGDAQSWPLSVPAYSERLEADVRGRRIGVPRRYVETASVDPEAQRAFADGLRVLERLGMVIVDIELPGLAEARMANFVILNAEAHADHAASLRTHAHRYGHSAYLYHQAGAFVSAAEYLACREMARQVRRLVEAAFAEVDVLATPTSPFVTSEAARQPGVHGAGGGAVFTSPFNATGHPGIGIPCGLSASSGLPIGMQLAGPLYGETRLFQIAHAYELATDWVDRQPAL